MTTPTAITGDQFTDLGSSDQFVQNIGAAPVYIVYANAMPAVDAAGHVLEYNQGISKPSGVTATNVFARCCVASASGGVVAS